MNAKHLVSTSPLLEASMRDNAESSSGESDLELLALKMPAGTKVVGKRFRRSTEAVSYEALQAAGYAQLLRAIFSSQLYRTAWG